MKDFLEIVNIIFLSMTILIGIGFVSQLFIIIFKTLRSNEKMIEAEEKPEINSIKSDVLERPNLGIGLRHDVYICAYCKHQDVYPTGFLHHCPMCGSIMKRG